MTTQGEITSIAQAIDCVNADVSLGVILLAMDNDTYCRACTYCERVHTVGLTGFTEECVREEHDNPGAGRRSYLAMLRAARVTTL